MATHTERIYEAVQMLNETIPPQVVLVAAAKGRTLEEVETAVEAGITHVGHNYVQEAEPMIQALGDSVTWHMIGHLQRNKAKRAVRIFDMIETVDSLRLAQAIERNGVSLGESISVLVEINSGREASKTGILPEQVAEFVTSISALPHLRVMGLMTMGPRFGDPENARPYFRATREAFDRLAALDMPQVSMRYLSMGMTNSYLVAIEEGANVIRLGEKIFGPHPA